MNSTEPTGAQFQPSRDAAEEYYVKLTGPGLSLDQEIGKAAAFEVMAVVMGGVPVRPSGGGAAIRVAHAATGSEAPLALREYLEEVEARRNPDKIVAIANYLIVHRGHDTITGDDVKSSFREAGESLPGNYSRDFRWTVQNGWLAEVHGAPGEYYVTKSGERAIAEKFSSDIKKKTGVVKSRRRRRKPTGSSADE